MGADAPIPPLFDEPYPPPKGRPRGGFKLLVQLHNSDTYYFF